MNSGARDPEAAAPRTTVKLASTGAGCGLAKGGRGGLAAEGKGKQHLPPVAGKEGRKDLEAAGGGGVRGRSTLCFLTNTPSAPWRLLFKNSYFHLHCSNTRQDEIIANPSSDIYA